MSIKICVCLGLIWLLPGFSQSFVWAQDFSSDSNADFGSISSGSSAVAPTAPDESLASVSISRETLERFTNLTRDEPGANSNLWLLVPRSNLTGGSQSNQNDFELFNLNTNQLFNLGVQQQDSSGQRHWIDQRQSGPAMAALQMAPVARGARKLGLFSNVLNKPKVSPLYLVNGTVCRFVNSQPICTTLSTTGLFRGNPNQFNFLNQQNPNLNPNPNQNQNGGFFNNNNNNQQQQLPNSRQVSPPQQNNFQQGGQNFNPQGGFQQNGFPNQQQQQFRPSALMDDGTQAVNLTNRSASNSVEQNHTMTAQRNPVSRPPPPTYSIVQRRPLNLLSLTRPFRTG